MTIHPKTCLRHYWVCHFDKYICFWCGVTKTGDNS
ncbi:hypothetical protein SEA_PAULODIABOLI_74 [Microbacterium phage PauloDiaboli]|nr:hypothetical protein SEA_PAULODIABOLI_74 [Microbacterium phage PauloDiaboli]